jgi:hypothetical protein
MGQGGKAIPPSIDKVVDLQSDAEFILLVEKCVLSRVLVCGETLTCAIHSLSQGCCGAMNIACARSRACGNSDLRYSFRCRSSCDWQKTGFITAFRASSSLPRGNRMLPRGAAARWRSDACSLHALTVSPCSLFLRKMKTDLRIPVLALLDADPYGLKVRPCRILSVDTSCCPTIS